MLAPAPTTICVLDSSLGGIDGTWVFTACVRGDVAFPQRFQFIKPLYFSRLIYRIYFKSGAVFFDIGKTVTNFRIAIADFAKTSWKKF